MDSSLSSPLLHNDSSKGSKRQSSSNTFKVSLRSLSPFPTTVFKHFMFSILFSTRDEAFSCKRSSNISIRPETTHPRVTTLEEISSHACSVMVTKCSDDFLLALLCRLLEVAFQFSSYLRLFTPFYAKDSLFAAWLNAPLTDTHLRAATWTSCLLASSREEPSFHTCRRICRSH